MFEDEFSFKFPELNLDFGEIDKKEYSKSTLEKIFEYLDEDIEEQNLLLKKLLDFERKLDQSL
jgi:hypothetical protein